MAMVIIRDQSDTDQEEQELEEEEETGDCGGIWSIGGCK